MRIIVYGWSAFGSWMNKNSGWVSLLMSGYMDLGRLVILLPNYKIPFND